MGSRSLRSATSLGWASAMLLKAGSQYPTSEPLPGGRAGPSFFRIRPRFLEHCAGIPVVGGTPQPRLRPGSERWSTRSFYPSRWRCSTLKAILLPNIGACHRLSVATKTQPRFGSLQFSCAFSLQSDPTARASDAYPCTALWTRQCGPTTQI